MAHVQWHITKLSCSQDYKWLTKRLLRQINIKKSLSVLLFNWYSTKIYSLRPNQFYTVSFFYVPSFIYIPKIATFNNIKHYSTHYILPLSPLYNNKNTITPTTLLHYFKSIIIKYGAPTTLPTFHLTLLISHTFSWSPCPIPMYIIHRDGGSSTSSSLSFYACQYWLPKGKNMIPPTWFYFLYFKKL